MFLTLRNNALSYGNKFIKVSNILEYSRIIFHQKEQVQSSTNQDAKMEHVPDFQEQYYVI